MSEYERELVAFTDRMRVSIARTFAGASEKEKKDKGHIA